MFFNIYQNYFVSDNISYFYHQKFIKIYDKLKNVSVQKFVTVKICTEFLAEPNWGFIR